jgi:hypothetical protein
MLPDSIHRPAVWPRLLAPVDARAAPSFCLLLLTVACGLTTFPFACATPFAAFAALAGAMLPLSAALPVVVAAWIVNQAIGFGVLGYPVELNTFLWGFAIGAAALIATAVSALVLHLLPAIGRLGELALAILAAYAAQRPGFDCIPAVQRDALHEIKSSLILQPGPAALTDGLVALQAIILHAV